MHIIESLRSQIRQFESSHISIDGHLPFGVPEIDSKLAGEGLKLGALHEIAGTESGDSHAGAATLFAAGILARTNGMVLWCLRHRDLFAPALAQVGLHMDRVIFVEAGNEQTLLACFEEGLRHKGIAGVIGEVSSMSMIASRRLQLAAEQSGAIGIALWRYKKAALTKQKTAARTSWRIGALPSNLLPVPGIGKARWLIELERCRLGENAQFEVEACNETGHIALSSRMVNRQSEIESWKRGKALN